MEIKSKLPIVRWDFLVVTLLALDIILFIIEFCYSPFLPVEISCTPWNSTSSHNLLGFLYITFWYCNWNIHPWFLLVSYSLPNINPVENPPVIMFIWPLKWEVNKKGRENFFFLDSRKRIKDFENQKKASPFHFNENKLAFSFKNVAPMLPRGHFFE